MSDMIDLHSHFLPGIDDGAQTMDEALALARKALDDGIVATVMTPHVHDGRYENKHSSTRAHFEAYQQALREAGIDLKVYLGAEVRISPDVLDWVDDGEIPFLGQVNGWRVMLLELPHSTIPVGTDRLIDKLVSKSIRPLIAHPERNKAIMDDPLRAEALVDAGCWLQVTGGSVVGQFGQRAQEVALGLLEDALVHVVASDAHNLTHRPPILSTAYRAIEQRWGKPAAHEVLTKHPAKILGLA